MLFLSGTSRGRAIVVVVIVIVVFMIGQSARFGASKLLSELLFKEPLADAVVELLSQIRIVSTS